jgi:hypothetical protein
MELLLTEQREPQRHLIPMPLQHRQSVSAML